MVVDFDEEEELVVDDEVDLDGTTTMTTLNSGFFKVPLPIIIEKKAKP